VNQSLIKQNTFSAPIVLDCFDYQSDRNRTARMVQPKTKRKTTMLISIGKGIELDVDVSRVNSEVHDHIVRTGLRNLLMDLMHQRLRRLTLTTTSHGRENWQKRN